VVPEGVVPSFHRPEAWEILVEFLNVHILLVLTLAGAPSAELEMQCLFFLPE